ncbi:DUF4270 domain-containing protein [Arcticibacter tournemirensis]|uniref:DUF4270 domain-containing protein n=1 Tax=Arcticibacter tournemirensis TaxID=699437 RepID=A0A4Q0M7I2_9SPHI|nr:DUF4270 domain-containing protein [Arcticibacter tournemirensis]RXF69060.1 DUF4270 domain-containing protein [Arcticibacter tournemirensis]
MKYFVQGLLITLIGLFAFSSCQKSDLIGLDINPQDSVNGKYIANYNVNTVTVRDDSVNTFNIGQYPLGSLSDPDLGTTEAGIAMQLSLPSSGFTFGTAAELDSAVLVMRYGNDFYGDSLNTAYKIDVYELAEKFGTNYYSNKEWSVGESKGSKEGIRNFAWRDSIRITQIVKGGPDTLVKVAPQLRIKLDKAKVETKLFGEGNTQYLANNTAFVNHLKGLYLKVSKAADATGGIAFLNMAATDVVARLDVFYRNTNSSGGKDTLTASFNVAGEAASIKHNYEGTAVKAQLDAPLQTFSTVYVQPMGGLKTKVTFPDLKNLKQLGNIAINKAELVVYTGTSTTSILEPSRTLTLYQPDIAGQRQSLPDQALEWGGVYYSNAQKRYIFNLSTYVQRILSGKSEQYPVYIISSDDKFISRQSRNISTIATTASRSILAGKDHPEFKIKLNIYYTLPHQ